MSDMSIADLAKIELHLHHEGAAPPEFIRQLAHEKKVDLSGIWRADGTYDFQGFQQFLRIYEAACSVLQTPEDFARLTRAILEACAENGVIYCESFISPAFCGGGDVAAWREYLAAMQEAAAGAERDLGIRWRGVATCVRHFGVEEARRAAACAQETAGAWLTGFGMGGDEGYLTQGDFAYAFDMAREAGLHLTTHAGEWGGAASVRDAIRDLGVTRVGHGVGILEDADVIKEVIERDIMLEVCPGSNVILGVVPNLAAHPIARLRDLGVRVSISTDDPPFFHTTLRDEYGNLSETFGWDAATFLDINRDAARAAFCDEATRAALIKELETSCPTI